MYKCRVTAPALDSLDIECTEMSSRMDYVTGDKLSSSLQFNSLAWVSRFRVELFSISPESILTKQFAPGRLCIGALCPGPQHIIIMLYIPLPWSMRLRVYLSGFHVTYLE